MEAFGIFEGGGAKGLAHVGALKAIEENEITFKGVAGTSAGAIIAALIAVGYESKDLYSSGDPLTIYGKNFLTFFDEKVWQQFQDVRPALKKVLNSGSHYSFAWNALWAGFCNSSLIKMLSKDQGIFTTEAFEQYLNTCLFEKLSQKKLVDQKILFRDIDLPLKIVATDVTNRKAVVFSKNECPDYEVAKAVAASVSLPLFFKPQSINTSKFKSKSTSDVDDIKTIDGGLLSNFPAWLFDEERAHFGPHIPTFGFRLVQIRNDPETTSIDNTFNSYLNNVVGTILNGDPLLETREIENLHEIPLKVHVGTLDFQMNDESKDKLFQEGYDSAKSAFNSPNFPRDRKVIEKLLTDIRNDFRNTYSIPDSNLVRANIITLTTRRTLRVMYTSGMDDHTDDRLEFPLGTGACSKAFLESVQVICDLEKAKNDYATKWQMSKYQQALVHQGLKTLICYPLIIEDQHEKQMTLGVLNIDTDYYLNDKLSNDEKLDDLMNYFSNILTSALESKKD